MLYEAPPWRGLGAFSDLPQAGEHPANGGWQRPTRKPIVRSMKRRTDERGQAMVEFTLIATVLATLLLAIFQFGQTFANYISVADAARAAARKASTTGASSTYDSSWVSQSRALATSSALDSAGDTCAGNVCTTTLSALNGVDSNWVAGNPVTATVTAPYSIKIFGLNITSGTLKHSVTMRIENKSPST